MLPGGRPGPRFFSLVSVLVVFGVVTIGGGTAGLPNKVVVVVGVGVVPLGSDFFLFRPAKEKKYLRKQL